MSVPAGRLQEGRFIVTSRARVFGVVGQAREIGEGVFCSLIGDESTKIHAWFTGVQACGLVWSISLDEWKIH